MNGIDLKRWRDARHLTQTDLADRLGVAMNTVYRWEMHQRKIPAYLELALEALDAREGRRKEFTELMRRIEQRIGEALGDN